ncbi:glutamine synthetase III [Thermoclostridium stercorarium]|uniref:glutamine synthetase III family protein n=1 Tax=Thermoclostridium stercorarium TaxID=1510 RepID=UPI002248888C|nr:glutamine synthetase III [Thermoclostridium stercorarium]UZQ84733.1 glutamine synthetase III [Thermoclostridium stercorarium]
MYNNNISENFGSMVFNEAVMRERLPKDIYKSLKKSITEGTPLELDVANVVASVMKDWAIEKGATHFTHWFQPMTGITAEKHDSFLAPDGTGRAITEFSGKSLVKGEPDASSFPSGGLRSTFEARGYTAWDPTSYAFIKDNTLYIPTAFCSYSGEALDKKTPLLRSMHALNEQALRILRLFGLNDVKRVVAMAGPEQEYFLIDMNMYLKRPDLMHCGRTLFGARPPKGQELEDHYFRPIKQRVLKFMRELDEELWKLGVYAKTEHNEVAPSQHEIATIYAEANVATDQNQLTMELMKTIGAKHGLACLLHEKPFAGINGSGKHVNWSLATDTGINLLDPGDTPFENALFLLFLVAVIKAVDDYQDLLRVSVASAGNDHRLGANEAPPAIVSIFLGDELTGILNAIENDALYECKGKALMEIGAPVLPRFPKDSTDRNRTSPFAFTGNKFELRMLGSAFSIAGPLIVLNTIVAESLRQFADELENSSDFKANLNKLIKRVIREHKRIIFNGNGYDGSWVKEAEARGLSNLKTTPDALPAFVSPKSIELFTRHRVFTEHEIRSRYEILLENYSKTINIEALTMIDMVNKMVIPAVFDYQNELAELAIRKKSISPELSTLPEEKLLERLSKLSEYLTEKLERLTEQTIAVKEIKDNLEMAKAYREKVCAAMSELRMIVDELELIVSSKHWRIPSYSEILNSVYE